MDTPYSREEIVEFFGNPASDEGALDKTWEAENIRLIEPPAGWQLFYQDSQRLIPTTGIKLHRLLEESFQTVLSEIWQCAKEQVGGEASEEDVRRWLHEHRLDRHGGGFNFRQVREGSNLSLHAYGIAIDWDPLHNPRCTPLTCTLPDWWFEIWAKNGWSDGRDFPTPDPMHVQFANCG